MTISQQTLRKERSFSIFFMTYLVVIPTKTYTSLVSTYLYPRIIKLRRKSHNLSQKSLFWTSIEPFAIRSFTASFNVCPVAIPELFAQTQGPIIGYSFITIRGDCLRFCIKAGTCIKKRKPRSTSCLANFVGNLDARVELRQYSRFHKAIFFFS